MPIHDWTRVNAGIFHHFHQDWIVELARTLNRGRLPEGYYALVAAGLAVADAPPNARFVQVAEREQYAAKATRIAIHHPLGEVVAVLEIVSPGNKASRHAVRAFVDEAVNLLDQGIHLLIVDLFPPTPRDPQGIHKAIWDEIHEEPSELPSDKSLTVVSYDAGRTKTAYVEPLAVGDPLPDLPLFLAPGRYVPTPLEETYQSTWSLCPAPLRELVQRP